MWDQLKKIPYKSAYAIKNSKNQHIEQLIHVGVSLETINILKTAKMTELEMILNAQKKDFEKIPGMNYGILKELFAGLVLYPEVKKQCQNSTT